MRKYKVTLLTNEDSLATVVELLAPEGPVTVRLYEEVKAAEAPAVAPVRRLTAFKRRPRVLHPFATREGLGPLIMLRAVSEGMEYNLLKDAYVNAGLKRNGASPCLSKLKRKGLIYSNGMGQYALSQRGEAHLAKLAKHHARKEESQHDQI